jgi:hypothetical protein
MRRVAAMSAIVLVLSVQPWSRADSGDARSGPHPGWEKGSLDTIRRDEFVPGEVLVEFESGAPRASMAASDR